MNFLQNFTDLNKKMIFLEKMNSDFKGFVVFLLDSDNQISFGAYYMPDFKNTSKKFQRVFKNFLDKFDNCDDKAYNLLFLDNKKLIALEKKENIKRYNLSEINKIVNSHFLSENIEFDLRYQ